MFTESTGHIPPYMWSMSHGKRELVAEALSAELGFQSPATRGCCPALRSGSSTAMLEKCLLDAGKSFIGSGVPSGGFSG